MKTVILPEKNKNDLKEIPPRIIKGMQFIFVENIEQALKTALK
ncbi:MAG: S16 family serine protease [Planctomycetota bacterium]